MTKLPGWFQVWCVITTVQIGLIGTLIAARSAQPIGNMVTLLVISVMGLAVVLAFD